MVSVPPFNDPGIEVKVLVALIAIVAFLVGLKVIDRFNRDARKSTNA